MFTGIIESIGQVVSIHSEGSNVHFGVACDFLSELKVDQSVAHNGVCLTVVELHPEHFVVTAIQETLDRTNLGHWKEGTLVNLERCTPLGGRLDGHIVQGHVDATGVLKEATLHDGSWMLHIEHVKDPSFITVSKGSVTVNGISLTVVDSNPQEFSVAIIPYTWEHTNLHMLEVGSLVNLEFDIIGKYVARMLSKMD